MRFCFVFQLKNKHFIHVDLTRNDAACVVFTRQTALPHLSSFQLWLESSGWGLGKQQPHCILVVVLVVGAFFFFFLNDFFKKSFFGEEKNGDLVSVDIHLCRSEQLL